MLFLFANTYNLAARVDPLQRQLVPPHRPVWERRIDRRNR